MLYYFWLLSSCVGENSLLNIFIPSETVRISAYVSYRHFREVHSTVLPALLYFHFTQNCAAGFQENPRIEEYDRGVEIKYLVSFAFSIFCSTTSVCISFYRIKDIRTFLPYRP
jgi:hypothetical protein